jgi:hypothetical protein
MTPLTILVWVVAAIGVTLGVGVSIWSVLDTRKKYPSKRKNSEAEKESLR